MARPAPGALWGRSTWSWQLNSRWFVLLGGPRAAILQVADPGVGAGVAEYSSYRTDPLGRLQRTLESMLAIGFGPPEVRREVLARLERIHKGVTGTLEDGSPYSALDPELQYWVLATLVDTVLVVERRYVGELTEPDRERYFEESTAMAGAFGVPESIVPRNLGEFRAYMADRFASLEPSAASIDVASTLVRPDLPWVPGQAFVPLAWITTELLPSRLRSRLGIRDLTAAELAAVRGLQALSRTTLPRVGQVLSANPLNGRAIRGAA